MSNDFIMELKRAAELRRLVNRAVVALANTPDPARRKRDADERIGWWLSAALDSNDQVSSQFKRDIREWFDANDQLATATKLAKLLAIAQIELRSTEPLIGSKTVLYERDEFRDRLRRPYTQPAK